MRAQALASLARELQQHLNTGALATVGRVELSDGVTVDAQRMARIVLSDVSRIARGHPPDWLTDRERQDLQEDLLRLIASVPASVPP